MLSGNIMLECCFHIRILCNLLFCQTCSFIQQFLVQCFSLHISIEIILNNSVNDIIYWYRKVKRPFIIHMNPALLTTNSISGHHIDICDCTACQSIWQQYRSKYLLKLWCHIEFLATACLTHCLNVTHQFSDGIFCLSFQKEMIHLFFQRLTFQKIDLNPLISQMTGIHGNPHIFIDLRQLFHPDRQLIYMSASFRITGCLPGMADTFFIFPDICTDGKRSCPLIGIFGKNGSCLRYLFFFCPDNGQKGIRKYREQSILNNLIKRLHLIKEKISLLIKITQIIPKFSYFWQMFI